MQSVNVIVPILVNTPEQIAMTIRCIKKARESKIPFELVIVETKTDYFKDLADIYIWEKEKTTATISINRALKVCNKDWVVLLTNDVIVDDGWLEALFECFKVNDCGCATLGSTQFNHQKENKIEEGNWWSIVLFPQWLFEKVGYFDEQFRGVWDDTDLLIRIYKAGFKMYRNFNVIVEHPTSSHQDNFEQHKENYRHGQELFHNKHRGNFPNSAVELLFERVK